MAELSRDQVDEIALLARLHLEPDELTRLAGELGAILDHFSTLAAVDTTGIAPMTHVVPIELPLRRDIAMPSLPVDVALAGAPARDGDFIVVPSIIPGAAE